MRNFAIALLLPAFRALTSIIFHLNLCRSESCRGCLNLAVFPCIGISMTSQTDFDIIIAGGGLVGGSLAAALAGSDLRVAVIEPYTMDSLEQPGYDERTVALTYSGREIFSETGVWDRINELGAEPIVDIHVSNRGHFGMVHLRAKDAGTKALGYVIPTRVIGEVINQQLTNCDNVELICPATVSKICDLADMTRVSIEESGNSQILHASLAVIADGGRSNLIAANQTIDYDQRALLTIVRADRPHHGRAYERFTDEGPLALLPHSGQRYAVVWTSSPQRLEQRMAMSDMDFVDVLQEAFGDRAGILSKPSARKSYPLSRGTVDRPVSGRSVMIGNAAHIVHPVAGQGFNLGLRDVSILADLILQAQDEGTDVGDTTLLDQYVSMRQRETDRVQQFTHGLISLFSHSSPVTALARNLAMSGIELLTPAKRFLLRRTMGLYARDQTLRSSPTRAKRTAGKVR